MVSSVSFPDVIWSRNWLPFSKRVCFYSGSQCQIHNSFFFFFSYNRQEKDSVSAELVWYSEQHISVINYYRIRNFIELNGVKSQIIYWLIVIKLGFPWWFSGKELTCQWRRCRFDLLIKKSPLRRKWQSTELFLPGESYGQRNPWAMVHGVTKELCLQLID